MTNERVSTIRVPTWYLPSFYGDVRLESVRDGDEDATDLYAVDLSPTEEAAMDVLRRRAVARPRRLGPISIGREPWATEADFEPIVTKAYRDAKAEVRVRLRAPIAAVQRVLARAMKPGRATVSAVKFKDGRIEEVRVAETTETAAALAVRVTEKRPLALPEKPPSTALAKSPALTPDGHLGLARLALAEAAVTVAAPTIGCPRPDFGEAEVRARRVLDEFLDDRQREDLRRTGRFVTTGQDTGRRYLLSLRDAPDGGLRRVGGRSVYDLDAPDGDLLGGPLCVHDWTVPSAEELLALHVCLSLPGRERHLRRLPEVRGAR